MDRRRFRRWPRQLDVRVWKHGDEAQANRAVSTNVSRTGIFVRTQLVLPSGTRVRLEILHSARSFVSEGVVMRALKTPSHLQSVMPSGMGIRFLTTEELLEELLPGINLMAEERVPGSVGAHGGAQAMPVTSTAPASGPAAAPAIPSPPSLAPTPAAVPPAAPASAVPARPADPIRPVSLFPLRFRDREQYQRAFERDISTGGIFISTQRPLALDTVIEVEVSIDNGSLPPVRLQARVVHRLEPPPGSSPDNLLAGMGVQFLDVRRAVEQLRTLL
jgi:Tfp pilus assembly protein PilZ